MRFQDLYHSHLAVVGLVIAVSVIPLNTASHATAADGEGRIAAALEQRAAWSFVDESLDEVLESVSSKLNVDVVLDVKSLEDFGIDPGTPVTRKISGVSTRSFLRLMLSELELTYLVRDDAIWVTTPEAAESMLSLKVYPVGDLLHAHPDDAPKADYSALSEAIQSCVAPDSWANVGGPSGINSIYGSLVITQTRHAHDEIAKLLSSYRQIIAQQQQDPTSRQAHYVEAKGNAQIRAALARPVTARFTDIALTDVAKQIGEAMKIPVVVDGRALEDFGIDSGTPLSGNLNNVRLDRALHRLLYPLDLTFQVRDEVLVITTPETAEGELKVVLYPVRDLVAGQLADPQRYDFDSLIQVITAIVAPDTWAEVGGPGALKELLREPTLVISQTEDVHAEIATLLAKLRTAKQQEAERQANAQGDQKSQPQIASYMISNGMSPTEVVAFIRKVTGQELWSDDPATMMEAMGPFIVVRHNRQTQQQIKLLLTKLGAWMETQAAPRDNDSAAPTGGMGGGGGFF